MLVEHEMETDILAVSRNSSKPREQSPSVSVIMIFLNAEKFIEEAIQSVLSQTFEDWELLLVDDGSTDTSTEMAKRYTERFPTQVRYLEHPGHQNHGMSASRNLGIRHARGEYIAFLDADDVYLPRKLEKQVAILKRESKAQMTYGATLHWYSWTGRAEDLTRDMPRKLGVPPNTLVHPPRLLPLFLRLEAQTPGICGILVRRTAIDEIGGFEASFRGMYEDQVLIYKLMLRMPVYIHDEILDHYRQHADSHQRVTARREYNERRRGRSHSEFIFLNWLQKYLLEQKIQDKELWHALYAQLWRYQHPQLYRVQQLSRKFLRA
ncbi:MAG TPA: glycosyltransferase family A protein [Anaerolineae bacterium]|nr:glycosyltransferase family A protein [Anaerolineae bacterium]